MHTYLNDFEVALISLILKTHDPENKKWANILTTIQVSSREITGVGSYINFENNQARVLPVGTTTDLGFDGEIIVPDVPSGLGCVLAIDDGRLSYLEFFTYGDEEWNGLTKEAKINI
jgi:hypothetical protein